jgi:DNA-binding XRE family transcriptional regulator
MNVTITDTEYQELVDARDHAVAMRDVANGTLETLTDAEMDAYLAAPTPLAYWRKRRGITQTALAARIHRSQPYIAQLESGARSGDVVTLSAIGRVLGTRIEDLIAS